MPVFPLLLSAALVAQPGIPPPQPPPAPAPVSAFDPPAEITPRGGFAVYTPPAAVVSVEYVGLDGQDPFDAATIGGSHTAFLLGTGGLAPGTRYRFVGIASDAAGKLTRRTFAVVVPGPPTPPTPPKPPTPPPDSALRKQLRAALEADIGDAAAKDLARKDLVALYQQAVPLTADKSIATRYALRDRLKAASKFLTADTLVGLRTTIAEVVSPPLTPDGPLTDADRTAAATVFGQLAAALDW